MKRIYLIFVLSLIALNLLAQNDTLYVYKSGNVIYQRATINVDSIKTNSQNDTIYLFENNTVVYSNAVNETDSILFYNPAFQGFICGVDSVYDIDGNAYSTIQLGNQCWMRENLAVKHYPDGTAIPHIPTQSGWAATNNNNTDDAWCYYNNDTANADVFGLLYTYAAAIAVNWTHDNYSLQGICPDGWHLPSDDEWKQLELFVGMPQNEVDLEGWRGQHVGSNLSANKLLWVNDMLVFDTQFELSGFDALPAGRRVCASGDFVNIYDRTVFRTSTEYQSAPGNTYCRRIDYDRTEINRLDLNKSHGQSIRCVKD